MMVYILTIISRVVIYALFACWGAIVKSAWNNILFLIFCSGCLPGEWVRNMCMAFLRMYEGRRP